MSRRAAATIARDELAPPLTLEFIRNHPRVKKYVSMADAALQSLGWTEHGMRHVCVVSHGAFDVLKWMGRPARQCELAGIAGMLHDIGNAVNREQHAQTGGAMAMQLLSDFGMSDDEILPVIAAIGNHHETDGAPVNDVAAAVILADKSDVHRSRVRNRNVQQFEIHDRVNHAVTKSALTVSKGSKHITLELTLDPAVSHVMEYFEIFMTRMVVSRTAAAHLGATFGMRVNGNRIA